MLEVSLMDPSCEDCGDFQISLTLRQLVNIRAVPNCPKSGWRGIHLLRDKDSPPCEYSVCFFLDVQNEERSIRVTKTVEYRYEG